jgi:serine/threonine-protein kinase
VKDAASPVKVGDVVDGKYRVERVIGSGGMGVVVAAEHLKLGRTVALKFLLKHACENHEAVTRFLREGQALASITSAHVARVMDVGTLQQGEPYLVMEYLEGADLGVTLKQRGRLPIGEAVSYVLQVCEAVAEAHAKGIVHRDLKPSNLFLAQGADGIPLVKVLDFGISKAVVQQPETPVPAGGSDASTVVAAHVTSTGALVGSPLYMSPEQIRNARRVDERTDIWSIGVILYELVGGAPPFEGETLSGTLAAVSADPPRPLHALRENVPSELESAILRCLQKSPDQRYSTMAELARALEPFAPVDARPSIARIARLLGTRSGRPGTLAATPTADEAAPTVPSWEGNTAPASTIGPFLRTRALLALALGATAAGVAWLALGRSPQASLPPPSSAMVDAAAKSMAPASPAALAPPELTAPPSATPEPTASAAARASAAATPASASATPATSAPKAKLTPRTLVTTREKTHAQNPPDRDGTEDRK